MNVLADNGTMAPSELRLNSETFSWLSRIPPILEEHKQLITQSRRENEEGLKVTTPLLLLTPSYIDALTLAEEREIHHGVGGIREAASRI